MTPSDPSAVLQLGGAFTIERAAELKGLLLQQIMAERPECLGLRGITELDTAGLQLLLAIKRCWPRLRLVEPSPAVCQVVDLLRLEDFIG